MQIKLFLCGLVLTLLVIVFVFKFDFLELRQTNRYGGGGDYFKNSPPLFISNASTRNMGDSLNGNRRDIFPSKDVLIRAVYFDSRPRKGHHNASVYLVLVWKNITDNNLITGCQVGKKKTKHFDVQLIGETGYWRVYPQYNIIDHEEVMVHCYDLPVYDGEEALLYYKMTKDSNKEIFVRSERPLMFPKPRVKPTSVEGLKYNLTILTCTKVFNNPTWMKEWLLYQRSIGVDHVHLTAEETFFQSISKELASYLESLIAEGYLSVEFWVTWLQNGKQVWYHNQGLILEDCIYQFRGTYDYVYILDTDDFFVPRVPEEKKAHYYIDRFCVREKVGNCKFMWVEFYPDTFGMNKSISVANGNMTNQLLDFSHMIQGNRKSVHRTEAIVDAATHYAFDIIEGYERVEYPMEVAYVAHVRKSLPPDMKSLVKGLP